MNSTFSQHLQKILFGYYSGTVECGLPQTISCPTCASETVKLIQSYKKSISKFVINIKLQCFVNYFCYQWFMSLDICVHCGNLREEPNYIHLIETLDNVS